MNNAVATTPTQNTPVPSKAAEWSFGDWLKGLLDMVMDLFQGIGNWFSGKSTPAAPAAPQTPVTPPKPALTDDQEKARKAMEAAMHQAQSLPENLVYSSRDAGRDPSRKLEVTYDAERKLYIYRDGQGHVGESPDSLERITERMRRAEESRAAGRPRQCNALTRQQCR